MNSVPGKPVVRGNNWRQVDLPDADAFMPARPVSVIVPCYQQPQALALTLAGLETQRFPSGLFEVVVVDDGSEPPIAAPSGTPLNLCVVHQPRRGFGLARARNAGARAAAHDILVFLDGDVIPEAGMLAAHARWHETFPDALTLGFCSYVPARGISAQDIRTRRGTLRELFAGRPSDPPWFERHMARTEDFTMYRDDLFRAATGHNFAVGRGFFDEIGGFDESFTRYGGEDTEFAYRAQVRGALLVPVRDACGWHQGRWNDGRAAKERSMDRQAQELARRIAEPSFRPDPSALMYAVPRHVVSLDGRGEPVERILDAVDALLADPGGDLAVLVEIEPGREMDRCRLEDWLGQEPRAQVASLAPALDAYPASPFHVCVPVAANPDSALVARLRNALGNAVSAGMSLAEGKRIEITRTWALARARRAGGSPVDYGEARELPPFHKQQDSSFRRKPESSETKSRPAGDTVFHWMPGQARHDEGGRGNVERRGMRAILARIWSEARHVRGARTAWRFIKWFAGALRWRLREGGGWSAAPVPAAVRHADPPLGAAIALCGPRSQAVFAASSQVLHAGSAGHADAVLADTPAHGAGIDAPGAALDAHPHLAVPAFDPAMDNPMGWVREVESRSAAPGPVELLPAGLQAHRQVSADDRAALLHCHHLVDTAAFHAGAATRAGVLARIAAWGVPVCLADRDPGLETLLGSELYALMTGVAPGGGAIGLSGQGSRQDPAAVASLNADARTRELLSIAMRRAALRTHSLRARARQVCAAAGADAPELPLVSVLLATCRPGFLKAALANVACQTWPRLELVLALHGPGFTAEIVETALAGFERPVKLLRLGADLTLGAVLQAAATEAGGSLLAKMDDDDLYGPEHLWDLALAHEYSGATLVGKFPATVYLRGADVTLRRRTVPGETWSRCVNGGAMLLRRADLKLAGGWRALPRHVDQALVDDVLRCGGAVYRTHDAGYLLVRHGEGHTWETGEKQFLADAETVQPGFQPRLAGIDGASPPGTWNPG